MNDPKLVQHTPGPWDVWPSIYEGMGAAVVRNIETLETIAEVRDYANARLIAAAPELLEALKTAQLYVANVVEAEGALFNRRHLDSVNSAISKATGEDYE